MYENDNCKSLDGLKLGIFPEANSVKSEILFTIVPALGIFTSVRNPGFKGRSTGAEIKSMNGSSIEVLTIPWDDSNTSSDELTDVPVDMVLFVGGGVMDGVDVNPSPL